MEHSPKQEVNQFNHTLQSDLLTHLSYELRGPLTSIMGLAQLLNADFLFPDQQSRVRDILQASEHMFFLVNTLLDNAKLEADRQKFTFVTFDLRALLAEAITILRFQAQSKGLQLALDYASELPALIRGNKLLLRQVMVNLLNRSLSMTEQGSIILEARCLERTPKSAAISLTIKDTSRGMSPEKLAATKACLLQKVDPIRYYNGVDFGLALAAKHLDSMQSRLTIDNLPDDGAIISCVISFQLPEVPEDKPSIRTIDTKFDWTLKCEPFPRPIRVLLAEDDPIQKAVYEDMVGSMECLDKVPGSQPKIVPLQLDVEISGEAAVKHYASQEYDVLLIDIGLPDYNGFEVAARIRKLEIEQKRTPRPIIAITAHGLPEDEKRFIQHGGNRFLIKPFTSAFLHQVISQQIFGE